MFVDSSVSWRRTLPYGSSRVEIIVYCSSERPELILIRILYSCGGEWRDSWSCLLGAFLVLLLSGSFSHISKSRLMTAAWVGIQAWVCLYPTSVLVASLLMCLGSSCPLSPALALLSHNQADVQKKSSPGLVLLLSWLSQHAWSPGFHPQHLLTWASCPTPWKAEAGGPEVQKYS